MNMIERKNAQIAFTKTRYLIKATEKIWQGIELNNMPGER